MPAQMPAQMPTPHGFNGGYPPYPNGARDGLPPNGVIGSLGFAADPMFVAATPVPSVTRIVSNPPSGRKPQHKDKKFLVDGRIFGGGTNIFSVSVAKSHARKCNQFVETYVVNSHTCTRMPARQWRRWRPRRMPHDKKWRSRKNGV